jgi:hypothetical protein
MFQPTIVFLLSIVLIFAAPYQAARAESAKVTGGISCDGAAVGISIDIDGDIDAATVESVRNIFDQYHETAVKVRSIKCPHDANNWMLAEGSIYRINSRGGSVAAAMAIGRIFRHETAWLGVDGDCISACVLILAGAVDRQIGRTAVIGIHRPYLGTTSQHPLTTGQVSRLRHNVARHADLSSRDECLGTAR